MQPSIEVLREKKLPKLDEHLHFPSATTQVMDKAEMMKETEAVKDNSVTATDAWSEREVQSDCLIMFSIIAWMIPSSCSRCTSMLLFNHCRNEMKPTYFSGFSHRDVWP
ncbi:hypothetical protein SEVIR_4G266350v4 [Setaria viridis]